MLIPGIATRLTGTSIPKKMPEALQSTVDRAYEIDYAELPQEVKTWITEHPYQTIFHVANGIVFFYPGLVTGPVLWTLGWTSTGPRGGKQPTLPHTPHRAHTHSLQMPNQTKMPTKNAH
jgi:hypothetical protein